MSGNRPHTLSYFSPKGAVVDRSRPNSILVSTVFRLYFEIQTDSLSNTPQNFLMGMHPHGEIHFLNLGESAFGLCVHAKVTS